MESETLKKYGGVKLGLLIVVVIVVVFFFMKSNTNSSNTNSNAREGFALDLSPRGGYPNCKGCVVSPVYEEPNTWSRNLYGGLPHLGISHTMSGTVFRDWQTTHGNNMWFSPDSSWERPVVMPRTGSYITMEELGQGVHDYWKNPYNMPAYAVNASPMLLPLDTGINSSANSSTNGINMAVGANGGATEGFHCCKCGCMTGFCSCGGCPRLTGVSQNLLFSAMHGSK